MTLQILFLLIAAFAVFIIVPIALIMSAVEHFRHKASDRKASGGIAICVHRRHLWTIAVFIRAHPRHPWSTTPFPTLTVCIPPC